MGGTAVSETTKDTVSNEEHFATYLTAIQKIMQRILRDTPCRVYLFGSRATGTAHLGSDADIAISADQDIGILLSQVRLALEESTIPYKIDLVDLSQTSADFRQQTLAKGILLWKN